MSRHIVVQDLPDGVTSVDQIPDDWRPRPLPFDHAHVVDVVRELAPDVDATDPAWLHVVLPGVEIEVNVADTSPLESFALHARGADRAAADAWVGRLLDCLGVRAFDLESESGIFGA